MKLIVKILNMGVMSTEDNHDSVAQPFCLRGETQEFQQGFVNPECIERLPDGINRNIRYLYQIIGNPHREVSLTDREGVQWTIMSLAKSLEIYNEYQEAGQDRVFDFAFRYCGLGHMELIASDTHTHNLFTHAGGGSSGWDREHNFRTTIDFSGTEDELFFLQWFVSFQTHPLRKQSPVGRTTS